MHSLRSRLVASHLVPLLLIIPLAGLTLTYTLERLVFLPALTDELTQQAQLIVALTQEQPTVWTDARQAQRLVAQAALPPSTGMVLVNASGAPVVPTAGAESLDTDPGLALAQTGQPYAAIRRGGGAAVAVVWVPAPGPDGQPRGALRLTQALDRVTAPVATLRSWIAGVLLIALAMGLAMAWALALTLEGRFRRLTEAVYDLAREGPRATLPEEGPDEMRQLLRAFNTLADRLRSLERSRRQLLANLVHELGRPLGAVQAAVQALRAGADEEPATRRELLGGVEGEVRRLGSLLDQLAHLHGQVLGGFELERRPLALAAWLPETLAPWRAAATAKGLTWQSAIAPDLPPLPADPERLAQVVGNLLSNAIRYTPPGGAVRVTAGHDSEAAWIEVADTGLGIAADEQPRIFDAFFRSRAHTRFPQGMGLGLSIARDIAAAHGGTLMVESAINAGSRFTLRLPLRDSPLP